MAVFFKPSDIVTLECSVGSMTRGGSAFAACRDGEQVFISPKIVDATGIGVGDLLTAYCIDNRRDDMDDPNRFAVRWRAIRVKIEERFLAGRDSDPTPVAAPATVEAMTQRLKRLMDAERVWTPDQLSRASADPLHRVESWLKERHAAGELARMVIEPSDAVYYGRDVQLFIDLVDGVTLED